MTNKYLALFLLFLPLTAFSAEWKKSTFSAVAVGGDGAIYAAVYGDAPGIGGKSKLFKIDSKKLELELLPLTPAIEPRMIRAILATKMELFLVSQQVIEMGDDLQIDRGRALKGRYTKLATVHCLSPVSIHWANDQMEFDCSKESDPSGAAKVSVPAAVGPVVRTADVTLPQLDAKADGKTAKILDYSLKKSRLAIFDSSGKELKSWSARELLGKP